MKRVGKIILEVSGYIAAVVACSLLLVLMFILVLFNPTASVYGFRAFADAYNKKLDKIFEKK